jgi:hypothetical protein
MNNTLRFKGEIITLRRAVKIAKYIAKTSTPGRVMRGDEHYLMMHLLGQHHRLKDCPKPVRAISVQAGLTAASKTFCAHYSDGSYSFFGVSSLLQNDMARKMRCFAKAARHEVYPQVKEFMAVAFGGKQTIDCAITSKLLYRNQATCDHYPTGFRATLDDWMKLNGLDWQEIAVQKVQKNYQFTDRELAASWQDYHQNHARFRVAEANANHLQGNPSEAKQCNL